MKAWSIVLFFVCLNLAGYTMLALTSDALDVFYLKDTAILPFAGESGLEEMKNQFLLTTIIGAVSGVGGAALLAIMLRQYVFGALAGAVWVTLFVLFPLGGWVLAGIGLVMNVLLYGTGLEFLSPVIYIGILMAFFALLAETLSGKQLT